MTTRYSGKRKRVVVLGATGSIGQSALKVARDIPERMEIIGLAANCNADKLATAANEMRPQFVCLVDETKIDILHRALKYRPRVVSGETGLREIACLTDADMVLVAIVGTAGLRPALAAIEAGKDLAVASKEILVMAGEIVMREAREHGVHVLPVDSEHNAIFQCLEGKRSTLNAQHPTSNAESSALSVARWTLDVSDIRRIILTASGGPFRETPAQELVNVTVDQALKHPTWNMGPKITIDSATLFNKALEMIEAHWLFGVEMKLVEVVIHPQSIVHSMVVCRDRSVLAQLGTPDMRVPIAFGLSFPERIESGASSLDFTSIASLTFEPPDLARFPGLQLAWDTLRATAGSTAVLNAANEEAVAAFLGGTIRFDQIHSVNAGTLESVAVAAGDAADIDSLMQLDARSRRQARHHVQRLAR